eukprot:TRINITY_DN14275_c0_g1_i2.p2 TRINITY_DN14275_c0_g1~~TRINITY_DN14275_c0_g1_i2.p2  ORF type:complete len:127 (-),score=16.45 TRINITY_DN14275_c0_g1_i2:321-701(-)
MKLRNHEIRNDEKDLVKNINSLVRRIQELPEFDILKEVPLKIKLSLPLVKETETTNSMIDQIESTDDYFDLIEIICKQYGFIPESAKLNKRQKTIDLELSQCFDQRQNHPYCYPELSDCFHRQQYQ